MADLLGTCPKDFWREWIAGFRGLRVRWWPREAEVPFPDWKNPEATGV